MQAAHSELDMRCQAALVPRNNSSLCLHVPEMRRNHLLATIFCGQKMCCFLSEQVLSGRERKAGFGRQQYTWDGTCTALSRVTEALLSSRVEKEERDIGRAS